MKINDKPKVKNGNMLDDAEQGKALKPINLRDDLWK